MAWFKVDDGFYTSLKFLSIPRRYQVEAAGVWLLAGTWSADKMTDGFVPYAVMEMWDFDNEVVSHLVKVGLWDHDEENEGIRYHDWCDYQPTREALEAKSVIRSEKAKQNVAKRWEKAKSDTEVIPTAYESDTNGIQKHTPEPEPEPEPEPVTSNEVTNTLKESFSEFWGTYPRRASRPQAVTAFAKAMKRNDFEAILEGARRYANDPNRVDAYTKLPATWLNQECWNDPLLPDRTPVNAKERQREQAGAEFMASFNQPLEITTNPDWA